MASGVRKKPLSVRNQDKAFDPLLPLLFCFCRVAKVKCANYHSVFVAEVTLKVHVSDASTHQPVTEAFIEIFTNQVPIASGNTGADGTAFIKFQYKLDSQLIVTATKQAYVPNSAPWKPVRLPGKRSLFLF